MRHTQHPSNNDVLAAPPGVSDSDCRPLPITRVTYSTLDAGQFDGVVSFWQPSARELELLNSGKPVRLSTLGRTHPPVALGVDGDGAF